MFDPCVTILDRVPAQFGQFASTVGDDKLCGYRRQMKKRAVALGLGCVETQLVVQIIESDRLQIVNSADGKTTAYDGERPPAE